jgi:hypothetical protein
MKEGKLWALSTGRPANIPGTQFCCGLSWPQGHSAAERIMSIKNSSEITGKRTRDLPAWSAVPDPIAPLLSALLLFSCFYPMNVDLCHHGMARPQVADRGTASNMECKWK